MEYTEWYGPYFKLLFYYEIKLGMQILKSNKVFYLERKKVIEVSKISSIFSCVESKSRPPDDKFLMRKCMDNVRSSKSRIEYFRRSELHFNGKSFYK